MPQSQEQGGFFQGRDAEKVLNFPTTGQSVETRQQRGQRRGKIHRNSSSRMHKFEFNSRTRVKSSEIRTSERSATKIVYRKPAGLLHATLFECSEGK